MDDLEQKLSSLLNDPAAMERVQGLLQSLGASGAAEPPASAPEPAPEPAAGAPAAGAPDLSELLGLLGAAHSAPPPAADGSAQNASAAAGDERFSKLTPLLTASAGENPDAALLKALRPYLHGDREKRLDDALQVMRLTRLLPLLRL